MSQSLLKVENLGIQFGGLKAVSKLSFEIAKGDLFGLIGPNGAGKTTVFNMITGVYRPTEGDLQFEGQTIVGLKPFQISHRGIARTFQNIRLFKELSVLENILVAASQHAPYGLLGPVLQLHSFKDHEAKTREEAMRLLSIFELDKKADQVASSLPYGQQRKLEIVRALATRPKLICLDEPAAGLNHQETHVLMDTIAKIRKDFALTVLLIEHDMKLVMGICEKIVVLHHGKKIEEGGPAHVQKSPAVIEAYLGTEAVH